MPQNMPNLSSFFFVLCTEADFFFSPTLLRTSPLETLSTQMIFRFQCYEGRSRQWQAPTANANLSTSNVSYVNPHLLDINRHQK